MSKPNLKSLNPMRFLKMDARRDGVIDSAEAKPVKKTIEYKANALNAALHPKKQFVKIKNVIERGNDVRSYVLVPNEAKGTKSLAYFSAGQYLAVMLDVNGAKISRPYSISSSPKEALEGKYVLTIKRVDGGLATNYILDNWDIGTEVTLSAPCGHFTYEPLRDAKTVVGLAGGSGITPFVSLAKAIVDGDEDASLTLIYGARTERELLFKAELDDMAAKCEKIKTVYVLSDEDNENYEKGFITKDIITKYAPEGEEYSIFMCGPQGMYEFLDKEIAELNIRQKFVRKELFGEYHNPEKNDDYPDNVNPIVSITLNIKDKTYVIKGASADTILTSIERAGISAPARCRSGECGFCHARLVKGKVYVPKSVDGRRLADFDYGYIHPCCTFATTDIEIDLKA